MNYKLEDAKKALYKISNPNPSNSLINNYKDFLQVRDYLHFYQFNIVVFRKLLKLTNDLWLSSQRISRYSLVVTLKRYSKNTSESFDNKTNQMLFTLFLNSIENTDFVTKRQSPQIQQLTNSLLKDRILPEKLVIWLCQNTYKSTHIINRLLRFPAKSKAVSKWALSNFEEDNLRSRRAELIGWVLNHNPNYVVPERILVADFEYMNKVDRQTLKDIQEYNTFSQEVDKEFGDLIEDEDDRFQEYREPKFTQRFYSVPLDSKYSELCLSVPDFGRMERDFYSGLNNIRLITMQWGIYYSHLPDDKKVELMKPYFNEETYWTTLKIAKKIKSENLLKWLVQKLDK